MWDVVVVGGGLAGLAAAATARKAGASAVVIERGSAGGRAGTVERDGFVFNMGAHALYLDGEGVGVLRSLGISPMGAPPPLTAYRLLADGALHVLPTGPASLLRTSALGLRSKAKLGRILARLPRLRASDFADVSISGWLADQDLSSDAINVARALIRLSTYSNAHDDLSAEAAILQLQRGAGSGVIYLDGGWNQLTDALGRDTEILHASASEIRDAGQNGAVVVTDTGDLYGRTVVLAVGTPHATRRILPGSDNLWRDVGEPVTAACLDIGVRSVPSPGYVLGAEEPLYAATQAPPARWQAPTGHAMVSCIKYGTSGAETDRAELVAHSRHAGVRADGEVVDRFLARMVVTGGQPRAVTGGLRGRPSITSTGIPNVLIAGDWVGPHGLLADAALASGRAAGLVAANRQSQVRALT